MRWKATDPSRWRVCFAWFPVKIDGQTLWLERYERRFMGDHYEVRSL